MRNLTVHTAAESALIFGRAANLTEAREGHAAGGIPEGGKFAHPASRSAAGDPRPSAGQQAPQGRAAGLPEPFRRAAGRSLKACLDKKPPTYCLELTEREYLHVRSAVERDRNATYKAIRKGLCSPDDLKGSKSLWRKLEAIMVQRMGYGRKP